MARIKKFLLSIISLSVVAYPLYNITSCSKINKKLENQDVRFNWDENKTLSVGNLIRVSITNFADLKNQGLADNMMINIDGGSVSVYKTEDAASNSDSFNLIGNKAGESTVTVTYTSILHLKVSTGKFKVRVVDYSKIKINYNDKIGTRDNPFSSNDFADLDIGYFNPKDWALLSSEFKSSLNVQAKSLPNEKNDSIQELYSFKIKDDGKIIATLKTSQAKWTQLDSFEVNVNSIGKTNFEDKGHTFWLGILNPRQSLDLSFSEITNIDYNGSYYDYKKDKVTKQIIFKVNSSSFDWILVNDRSLDNVFLTLSSVDMNQDDEYVILYDKCKLIADYQKKQFVLTIGYREVSFSDINLKMDFKFSNDTTIWNDSVQFKLSSHRHGVDETESDITKRELKTNFADADSYDFVKDSGIDPKNLINPFQIWPPVTDSLSSLLNANGYFFSDAVVLSPETFDNLKKLNFDKTEDKNQIKKINDTIEQINSSLTESDELSQSGVTLTADFTSGQLVLKCPGIKLNTNNSFNAGEYFIVIKYKDNKNNYQFSYVDFKWKAGTIEYNNNPVNIESHLNSMPIESNSNKKSALNNTVDNNIIFGRDSGAGTNNNPLMLTEEDSEICAPNSKRVFNKTKIKEDGYYRGYLKVNNIKSDSDVKNMTVSIEDSNAIAKLASNPIIKGEDGDYYIDMTLLGQKDKDVKAGNFTIKIVNADNIEYKFVIYYSAYIGASLTAGDFIADGFIDNTTSIYVSQLASNRELYLGLSNKSLGSINDVYFEDGYTYNGSNGVLTTDVGPNSDEPDSLKNIQNLTFAGELDIKSSYIFMASPNSGVTGYITFCGSVDFVSTNSYISASNKSDDPSFQNSAIILGGNLRNKDSSPIVGKKGVTFLKNVAARMTNFGSLKRNKESLSIIATTKSMIFGDVNFKEGVLLLTVNTQIRTTALITNEVILADDYALPNQTFGDINISKSLDIVADIGSSAGEKFNAILVDKKKTNFRSSDNLQNMATINVDLPNTAKEEEFWISPCYCENKDSKIVGQSFLIASDTNGIGEDTNNKTTLLNIKVNHALHDVESLRTRKLDKIILNGVLAIGKYIQNKSKLEYLNEDNSSVILNLSTLKDCYYNYTMLPES